MNTAKPARERKSAPLLKTFFKGLAISLGGGLLFRAGGRLRPGLDPMAAHPLTERLERAELSLSRIEKSHSSIGVEELRDWVQSIDRRGSEQMTAMGERLDSFERHIPELINVAVAAKIDEAERRIKAEIQQTQTQTLNALLKTVDQRITQGIGQVESSLAAQSREIAGLCQRMNETDANLVRILGIVEGKHFAGMVEMASRG